VRLLLLLLLSLLPLRAKEACSTSTAATPRLQPQGRKHLGSDMSNTIVRVQPQYCKKRGKHLYRMHHDFLDLHPCLVWLPTVALQYRHQHSPPKANNALPSLEKLQPPRP
jgi:hypothetical protein